MAPALSRLRENQNVIIGLTGVSAALWIIAYGKSSQKRRFDESFKEFDATTAIGSNFLICFGLIVEGASIFHSRRDAIFAALILITSSSFQYLKHMLYIQRYNEAKIVVASFPASGRAFLLLLRRLDGVRIMLFFLNLYQNVGGVYFGENELCRLRNIVVIQLLMVSRPSMMACEMVAR
uniref:Uncharacterized protein n=1 Tax=Glossina pallidipes TaxID=7398 RepID=A0A1A9ZK07_GLOPL